MRQGIFVFTLMVVGVLGVSSLDAYEPGGILPFDDFDDSSLVEIDYSGGAPSGIGVMLNSQWFVTSAYTLYYPQTVYTVETACGFQALEKVISHPQLGIGSGAYPNNLALAKLAEPCDDAAPAEIADPGQFDEAMLINPPEDIMGEVWQDVACTHQWGSNYNPSNSFCFSAESEYNKRSQPLFVKQEGMWKLLGPISWGHPTDWFAFPLVGHDLRDYEGWIFSEINL